MPSRQKPTIGNRFFDVQKGQYPVPARSEYRDLRRVCQLDIARHYGTAAVLSKCGVQNSGM
jgi:hypothetical protein